jgi:hypothetical protein
LQEDLANANEALTRLRKDLQRARDGVDAASHDTTNAQRHKATAERLRSDMEALKATTARQLQDAERDKDTAVRDVKRARDSAIIERDLAREEVQRGRGPASAAAEDAERTKAQLTTLVRQAEASLEDVKRDARARIESANRERDDLRDKMRKMRPEDPDEERRAQAVTRNLEVAKEALETTRTDGARRQRALQEEIDELKAKQVRRPEDRPDDSAAKIADMRDNIATLENDLAMARRLMLAARVGLSEAEEALANLKAEMKRKEADAVSQRREGKAVLDRMYIDSTRLKEELEQLTTESRRKVAAAADNVTRAEKIAEDAREELRHGSTGTVVWPFSYGTLRSGCNHHS